jgi:hypothetical protein
MHSILRALGSVDNFPRDRFRGPLCESRRKLTLAVVATPSQNNPAWVVTHLNGCCHVVSLDVFLSDENQHGLRSQRQSLIFQILIRASNIKMPVLYQIHVQETHSHSSEIAPVSPPRNTNYTQSPRSNYLIWYHPSNSRVQKPKINLHHSLPSHLNESPTDTQLPPH